MNVGIYDVDIVQLSAKKRFQIYKDVGFSHVGFYFDDSYLKRGETYVELLKVAREVGLKISQLHLDYKNSNMLSLNEDNEYLRYIEIKVDEAIAYGVKELVLHASKGNNPSLISAYSFSRLKKLSKKLSKYDVKLCFENVRDNKNLEKIMSKNYPNIFICYDSGHAHCYDNEFELLGRYKEKILTTHIHDNFGEDDHLMISRGNIDWQRVSKELDKTNRKIDFLECFPPRGKDIGEDDFIDFVKEAYGYYVEFFQIFPQS